jgi:hypothetical protein
MRDAGILETVSRGLYRLAELDPDGMIFDSETVQATRIKADADYEGVRVRFIGYLGKAPELVDAV